MGASGSELPQKLPQLLRVKRVRDAELPECLQVVGRARKRARTALDGLRGLRVDEGGRLGSAVYRRVAEEEREGEVRRAGEAVAEVAGAAVQRGRKRRMCEMGGDERVEGVEEAGDVGVVAEREQVQGGAVVCNGEVMRREEVVVEVYKRAREVGSDEEVGLVRAEDVRGMEFWFEEESSSAEGGDEDVDVDGQSVDYPSTPESSVGEDDSEGGEDVERRRVWFGRYDSDGREVVRQEYGEVAYDGEYEESEGDSDDEREEVGWEEETEGERDEESDEV